MATTWCLPLYPLLVMSWLSSMQNSSGPSSHHQVYIFQAWWWLVCLGISVVIHSSTEHLMNVFNTSSPGSTSRVLSRRVSWSQFKSGVKVLLYCSINQLLVLWHTAITPIALLSCALVLIWSLFVGCLLLWCWPLLVLGGCCGLLLGPPSTLCWSCVMPFSQIFFQCCSVSVLAGSAFLYNLLYLLFIQDPSLILSLIRISWFWLPGFFSMSEHSHHPFLILYPGASKITVSETRALTFRAVFMSANICSDWTLLVSKGSCALGCASHNTSYCCHSLSG